MQDVKRGAILSEPEDNSQVGQSSVGGGAVECAIARLDHAPIRIQSIIRSSEEAIHKEIHEATLAHLATCPSTEVPAAPRNAKEPAILSFQHSVQRMLSVANITIEIVYHRISAAVFAQSEHRPVIAHAAIGRCAVKQTIACFQQSAVRVLAIKSGAEFVEQLVAAAVLVEREHHPHALAAAIIRDAVECAIARLDQARRRSVGIPRGAAQVQQNTIAGAIGVHPVNHSRVKAAAGTRRPV